MTSTASDPRAYDTAKTDYRELEWFEIDPTIFPDHKKYEWKDLKKTNEDKLPRKLRKGW